ncbi:MAG: hypothetical protein LBM73_02195 [Candidatus Nomurabacteria bacterium]|jgi:signal transduction histidine kinase|nr:hypothetical protein [Candidatus Nomurabacteria bacterium]
MSLAGVWWQVVLMAVALLALMALAVVVLRSHAERQIRYSFALLLTAAALWTITNIGFQIESPWRYLFALLAYSMGCLMLESVVLFVDNLTHWHKRWLKWFYAVAAILAVSFALPGFLAYGVTDGVGGSIETTPWIFMYAVFSLVCVLLAGFRLRQAYVKASGKFRRQLGGVALSFAITVVLILAFNLAIPITGSYHFVALGPIVTLVFVGGISYSITANGLFGVRTLMVRAFSYVMMVLALLLIYVALIFLVATIGLKLVIPADLLWLSAGLIGATALLFQPIKRAFDRLTQRIFYRSSYDISVLPPGIYMMAIAETAIRPLLKKAADLISHTVNAERVAFALLNENPGAPASTFGTKIIGQSEIGLIEQYFKKNHQRIIELDEVAEGEPLKELAQSANVEVIARLSASAAHRPLKIIGYLIISERRNGAGYSGQDIMAFRTVADLLSFAIENVKSRDQIEQFNNQLESRIKIATAELRKSNRQLRQLDDAKDDFLSMASHQLRTPLTTIRGYLSMLDDGDLGQLNDQQRHVIHEAYTSSERMAFLISDFLDVSRLQTGRFELQLAPAELGKILTDEVEQLRVLADSHNVKLTGAVEADLPTVVCDKAKLRQVMMNMIDNAIYYSPADSVIEVNLYKEKAELIFTVKDHGIGVPEAEKRQLFGRFFRATNAKRARPDGTGVGLYVAKKVILAHRGRLIFDSVEGVGSTFGFAIPLNLRTDDD